MLDQQRVPLSHTKQTGSSYVWVYCSFDSFIMGMITDRKLSFSSLLYLHQGVRKQGQLSSTSSYPLKTHQTDWVDCVVHCGIAAGKTLVQI